MQKAVTPDEDRDDSEEEFHILVIGDPHFKAKELVDCEAYVEALINITKERSPSFVVLLGDILDTFETVKIQPHNLACDLIERLAELCKVYVLIGNHDMVNSSQMLKVEHIFGPLKTWQNVKIIDSPTFIKKNQYTFVFCPYVPPGSFKEALNSDETVKKEWRKATCIFAHQEFKGCKMGAKDSSIGDEWKADYPCVISGHIHEEQILDNIYYPGSSRQHSYAENPDKVIWDVTFTKEDESYILDYERVNLGLKGKKMKYMFVDDVDTFDFDELQQFHIKLNVTGTRSELKQFRKSKKYKELIKGGVKISTTEKVENVEGDGEAEDGEDTKSDDNDNANHHSHSTYREILDEMVRKSKNKVMIKVYEELSLLN